MNDGYLYRIFDDDVLVLWKSVFIYGHRHDADADAELM